MNKFCKYFAFASVLALASCSNDEPGNNNENELNPGDALYLNITLMDANDTEGVPAYAPSRADESVPGSGLEGGFAFAEGNEGKVNKAYFYFFNEAGTYVGQTNYGSLTNAGSVPENIEFKTPAMVVIQDQKTNEYPKYVVTVINGKHYTDADLNNVTLTDFGKTITSWGADEANGFVMTTTSYKTTADTEDHANKYYYATMLDKSNFARTPDLAKTTKPVKIYVERLAAKVKFLAPGNPFDIKATIYGANGDNPESGENESATKLKVRIDGWFINGVQEESYLSKQLSTWGATSDIDLAKNTTAKWEWNDPNRFRSYWAESVDYGNVADLTFYTYAADHAKGVNGVWYCNENTSSYTDLKLANADRPNQQKLTSVIVKATLLDAEGNELPFVTFNGLYFTHERFINYILNDNKANLPYVLDHSETIPGDNEGESTTKNYYKQVPASYYKLAGNNSGIYVAKGDNFPTELFDKDGNAFSGDIDATLKESCKGATASSEKATMYYNIPLAHFNSAVYDKTTGDLQTWKEGTFGVVRNHVYQVVVNSVKRIGTGVFNPDSKDDEDKITPDPDPNDPNYYLGAEINILSWKVVNNFVDL